MIHLTVQAKLGGTYTVEVEDTATIHKLKVAVWRASQVPPDRQQLLFEGVMLQDRDSMKDVGLSDGACVAMTILGLISQDDSAGCLSDDVIVCLASSVNKSEVLLAVSPFTSVSQLKKQYLALDGQEKTPHENIELIFNGQILSDHAMLWNYTIGYKEVTYIFVATKLMGKRGGSSSALEIFCHDVESDETRTINVVAPNDASVGEVKAEVVELLLRSDKEKKKQGLAEHQSKNEKRDLETDRCALVGERDSLFSQLKTQDFDLARSGMPLPDDTLVGAFAIHKEVTSLEVKLRKERCTHVQLNDKGPNSPVISAARKFEMAKRDPSFSKALQRAKQTLVERSAAGKQCLEQFHALEDISNEQTSEELRAATAFTAKVLKEKPSGDLSDSQTVVHVIRNWFAQHGDRILFYDSRKDMQLNDSSGCVEDLLRVNQPMILRLKDLHGLHQGKDASSSPETVLCEMQAAIDMEQPHPVLEEVKMRLSRALDVKASRIAISSVFRGSVAFQYTVDHLTTHERERMLQQQLAHNLAAEFNTFLELKLHPLLFRPAFDVAMFDSRGDKNFVNLNGTFQVGPPNQQKTYTQPHGWRRFGLKVLSDTPQENEWLHPFHNPGNWWRAFHGTANAGRYMEGVDRHSCSEMGDASLDAASRIHRGGFLPAHRHSYGPGVYCSPNPTWLERSPYVPTVPVHVRDSASPKNFRVMLQVAVRPGTDTLQPTSSDDIWAVRSPEWIRAYGILIKEA